jgi:NAD(P)-dependent dehydrogenase (short-subunit alcohol dehydrogenase family)
VPVPTPDLTGQVVVVTGANAGIGLETAAALAGMGATAVMTARDPGRGQAALEEVRRRTGSDRVVLGQLDLASFASIRAFAAWLLDEFDRLDVLVANAGLILDERTETAEGFETMFGVNHLGHFLLTSLLVDRLVASAPSRVVVVSSLVHRLPVRGLRRHDLQGRQRFHGFLAYSRSKLANAQFAMELARRLDGTGVVVHAVHPGSINSSFGGDGDTGAMGWLVARFGRFVLRTPEAGARTQVMLASSTDPKVAASTGGYWSHGRRWRPSRAARNPEAGRWLWEESERLVAAASAPIPAADRPAVDPAP